MRKLYRSRRDSKLTGLCGGLAEMLNVDPTLLRLIVVATAIFSGGAPVIFLYIIASIVIPKEPQFPGMFPPHGNPFGPGPAQPPMYGSQPMQPPVSSYGYSSHTVPHQPQPQPPVPPQMNKSNQELDDMMKDIEQKAMRKELDELRAKLAKYEKGE
ncbi:PspC domain-containing protein [Paenibacillus sp. MBLB4367]|uniref:PspC domain-containing protein n=1 Tax=Paenibacillus sp. MBLB4367 TaxID=3384767 RepID=UPI00390838AD